MRTSPYIRTHLKGYFHGVLEIKTQPPRVRSHTRVRIEGEVITSLFSYWREKSKEKAKETLVLRMKLYHSTMTQKWKVRTTHTCFVVVLPCMFLSFSICWSSCIYKHIHDIVYLMDCGK